MPELPKIDPIETQIGPWTEYQRLVLAELNRLSDASNLQTQAINAMRTDMAIMKTKWGFLSASIALSVSATVAVFVSWINRMIHV